MNFDSAFDKLIGHEGGFSKIESDPGNWTGGKIGVGELKGTKYGIAANTFPNLDIENLTLDDCKFLYKSKYWDKVHADSLPVQVRFSVFDMAVNSGVSAAIKILQRALGVEDDGIIGPKTLEAAAKADAVRLAARFNAHRLNLMTDLNNWTTFSRGWARRVAANLLEI